MNEIGKRIAKYRKNSGLTQEQLGKKLNVSSQAISKWENNVSQPDITTLEKLAEVFGISLAEFLNLSENNSPQAAAQKSDKFKFHKYKTWYLVAGLGILILILSLCAFLIPIRYSSKQIMNKYESSIFYLTASGPYGSKTGSGFFINNSGLALTNYENIEGCTEGKVKIDGKKEYNIKKIVGIDEERNLALIQIDISKSKPVKLGDSNSVEMGDKVFSLSFTYGEKACTIAEGMIYKVEAKSDGTDSIQSTASIEDALSGGILINEKGQAIAIISDYLSISGVGFDMVNVCVPTNKIDKISKDINLSLLDYYKQKYGTYNIVYDGNGATSGTMHSQECLVNDNFELNKNQFVKENYLFCGWEYNGRIYSDGTAVRNLANKNQTITLKAIWKGYYTISFDGNGATGGEMEDQLVVLGESTKINANQFSKETYQFVEWDFEGLKFANEAVINSDLAFIGDKIIFKAIWEYKEYQITYVLNGGQNSQQNASSYTIISDNLQLYNAEKSGFTFVGWYKESDFSGEKITEIPSGSKGDVILYAKFDAINYNITYVLNDGEQTDNPATYTVEDGNIPLKAATTNKEGFQFAGWYLDKDFQQPINNISCSTVKNYTLYGGFLSKKISEGFIELHSKYDLVYYLQSNCKTYNEKDYILCNDIDLQEMTWQPFLYKGNFNGNGHKIYNLYYTRGSSYEGISGNYSGFIAVLTDGTLKNLIIENPIFTEYQNYDNSISKVYTSGLIGRAENSTITNCGVQGGRIYSIYGKNLYIGGLVAYAKDCNINNCFSSCTLYSRITLSIVDTNCYAGAFAGYVAGQYTQRSNIENCYSSGTIDLSTSASESYLSGFIGYALYYNIKNCYSSSYYKYADYPYNRYRGGLVAYAGNVAVESSFAFGDYREESSFTSSSYPKGIWLVQKASGDCTFINCYSGRELTDPNNLNQEQFVDCHSAVELETILDYVLQNWDSNIWAFYSDKFPTLK